MKKYLFVCLSVFMSPVNSSPISVVAIDPSTASFSPVSNGTFGWQFHLNADVTISSLGFFDKDDDGLVNTHQVGIWDLSQNLLLSTTVLSGTSSQLIDNFRYTSISPATLSGGQDYIIGATNPFIANDIFALNVGSIAFDSNITFVGQRWIQGAAGIPPGFGDTLNFPVNSFLANSYFGPNFQIETSTVPAPPVILLFGSGLIGLIGLRRKPSKASILSA